MKKNRNQTLLYKLNIQTAEVKPQNSKKSESRESNPINQHQRSAIGFAGNTIGDLSGCQSHLALTLPIIHYRHSLSRALGKKKKVFCFTPQKQHDKMAGAGRAPTAKMAESDWRDMGIGEPVASLPIIRPQVPQYPRSSPA